MSGTVFNPDYTIPTGKDKIVSLVLPDAATSIIAGTASSDAAFLGFTALSGVSGANIVSLGAYAFYDRDTLSTLNLPVAAAIDNSAFQGCTGLSSADLPLATDIGTSVFEGCTGLSSVSLPAAASIGTAAFAYCTGLSSLSFPAANTIGISAFYGCTGLSSLSLPAAASIGTGAFENCSSLSSVTLPAAASIGAHAFAVCTGLSSVSLPAAASIGMAAFYKCTALSTLSLPANPPTLGGSGLAGAFLNTNTGAGIGTTLTITVPAGAVGNYTAAAAPGWGVTADTIAGGNTAKYGNDHKRVFITGSGALPPFLLTTIADITAYLSGASGGGSPASPVPLPAGLVLAASGGNGWADLLNVIQSKGKYVNLDLSACTKSNHSNGGGLYEDRTFDPDYLTSTGKGYIVSLVLPGAAESIIAGTNSNFAFKHFAALTDVGGANIGTVGAYAFYDRDNLTTAGFPAATNIGDYAFAYCDALTTVELPAATDIDYCAFAHCTSLPSVSLPLATSIGNSAFASCGALITAGFPAATGIGGFAFDLCTSLSTVDLSAAISIGDSAFHGCTALAALSLPASPPTLPALEPDGAFVDTYSGLNPSSTLTIQVPSGAVADYTAASGWNVSAVTDALGNDPVYGSSHKRIVITD
jgi:hypothetical protein